MCMSCKLEVEAWVVDEDECIGMFGRDGLFGSFEVAEYVGEMANDFAETHICHASIVDERFVAGSGGHEVASEECELRIGIDSANGLNELGGVYVA